MGIEEIVRVDIVRGNKAITRAGFGTGIILSPEKTTNTMETYNSLAAVAAVYATSTSIYKWAAKYFGQEKKPRQLKVARRTALVAQVNTLTILNAVDATFTVTINGVDYSFVAVAQTVAQIRTGVLAAIAAGFAVHGVTGAATVPAGEFTLTASNAGVGFSIAVTANIGNVATTPNNGVQEDLIAAQNLDNDFYGIMLVTRNKLQIIEAAKWVETQRKIFGACTNDADVKTNGAGNVAALLKSAGYTRTFLLWSGDQANGPEAAWFGRVLPLDSGSETWKFKDLAGVIADKFTDTELNNLKLNNVNNYRTFAGFSMTSEGYVSMGEFIDVIRFIDWFQAQLEENVFALLISVPKVPYTDNGGSMIQAVVEQQLARGIKVGGLRNDPLPEVTVPRVADIQIADRQSRTFPDVEFTAQLAGAIHFVEISGTVSV